MNDRELLVNHWSGLSSHRNILIAGFAGNSAPRRRLQRLKEALPATYNAHNDAYRVLNSVPEHVKLYVTALVECMRHLNSLPDTELSSIWRRPPKLPPSPPPSPSPLQGILPFEPCCCAHPRHVALWHSGLSGGFNLHRRWSASTCATRSERAVAASRVPHWRAASSEPRGTKRTARESRESRDPFMCISLSNDASRSHRRLRRDTDRRLGTSLKYPVLH